MLWCLSFFSFFLSFYAVQCDVYMCVYGSTGWAGDRYVSGGMIADLCVLINAMLIHVLIHAILIHCAVA